jgi:hypothetical protein
MSSLRTAIAEQPRFPHGETLDLSEVVAFLGTAPPVSVRALESDLDQLPEVKSFSETIVTGAALGGTVDMTFHRDGSYIFSGGMRATGFPSYSFKVVALVRSGSGGLVVAAQHSGRVYGFDTPGPRDNHWSEPGTDAKEAQSIRNLWPDLAGGTMVVNRSSDLIGVLGTVVDVVVDIGEYVVAAGTVGASVAVCLVVGSELQKAGIALPGLGGVVGLGIVAGTVYIWGPLYVVPAIVAGAVAGAVVDSMVKIRRISSDATSPEGDEVALARMVFHDTLDVSRIWITNLSGLGGAAFTTPTVDGDILVNLGNAYDTPPRMSVDPPAYPVPGQVLVHELTHAWQIEHPTLADGFVPGLMCSGIYNQVAIGKKAYQYGPPGQPWHSFNMEAQGAIVDQWFAGTTPVPAGQKSWEKLDQHNPYFAYIAGNIWTGIS